MKFTNEKNEKTKKLAYFCVKDLDTIEMNQSVTAPLEEEHRLRSSPAVRIRYEAWV